MGCAKELPNSRIIKFLAVLALSFAGTACLQAQPYSFTVVAGDLGYGVTDGTNTTARLRFPQGIVAGQLGTLFIADTQNHTIRKLVLMGTNWVSSTLAGLPGVPGSADGSNSLARFNGPVGIAIDSSGNLFISDTGNHTIRKLTVSGTNWVVTTLAGLAGASGSVDDTNEVARFNTPEGIAVDASGNIYVVDRSAHTVRKLALFGSDWVVSTLAGSAGLSGSNDGTGSGARFNGPEGVAVDGAGNVFVADTLNYMFRRITPGGVVTTIAGVPAGYGSADGPTNLARFNYPRGISVDNAGILYVCDTGNNTVRRIAWDGTTWAVKTLAATALSGGSVDATNQFARFNFPFTLTVDANTNLYLADSQNNMIRKVAPLGADWITTTLAGVSSFGSTDGTNNGARFIQPAGIARDSNGTFFVSDLSNNKIRTISRQGSDWIVRTIAGSGVAGRIDGTNLGATFWEPQGLSVDAAGNVIVADSFNNAIRKLTLLGTNWVTRTIGTGFSYPNALALDGLGNIFVANNSAHTICLMTPSGTNYVVSTIAGAPNIPGSADGTNANARFNYPNGIALDGSGNIYVADYANNIIRQIRPSGTNWVVQTIAGAAGLGGTIDGTNNGARFAIPFGVTVDSAGNLWVSQVTALRKMTHIGTNWVVTTVKGPGAQFFKPNSLMIDESANLYVTDTSHNVIQFGQPLFQLQSSFVQNNFVLSWPTLASNYFLEWTPDLVNPAWSPTTNSISTSGESFVVTNQINSSSAFYRLRKP